MKVSVKCFAGCKDAVGASAVLLDTPAQATVGVALNLLVDAYPAMEPFRSSLMLAVNREYADLDTVLQEGDELACIPPVSGGAR